MVEVKYREWHPEGDALWERLEIPTFTTRLGRYKDPEVFDRIDYRDSYGYKCVSYRDILTLFDREFSAAFVLEHYAEEILGINNPKVLEIGAWPMRRRTVPTEFSNSFMGILSRNNGYRVVGVDKINIVEALGFKSYTPPYFGNSTFINGDFSHKDVRAKIISNLGGRPDIIIGNMVFERRLGNWLTKDLDGPDRPEAAEEITRAAIDFMPMGSSLIICNRSYGTIPDVARELPLVALYFNEEGREYAQVRAK